MCESPPRKQGMTSHLARAAGFHTVLSPTRERESTPTLACAAGFHTLHADAHASVKAHPLLALRAFNGCDPLRIGTMRLIQSRTETRRRRRW